MFFNVLIVRPKVKQTIFRFSFDVKLTNYASKSFTVSSKELEKHAGIYKLDILP